MKNCMKKMRSTSLSLDFCLSELLHLVSFTSKAQINATCYIYCLKKSDERDQSELCSKKPLFSLSHRRKGRIFFLLCFSLLVPFFNVSAQSMPVYAQEYHIVYRTPKYVSGINDAQGDIGAIWKWWAWDGSIYNPEELVLNNWRRTISSKGYPLIGPYDSRNKDIIRWQIQLAKNSGLSGLFVDIFHEENGEFRTDLISIFEDILSIAQEENFKIGLLDEQYSGDTNVQNLVQKAARTIDFFKKYKSHPAYLKIKNQPVYKFGFYNNFRNENSNTGGWTFDELNRYFIDVETAIGDVFWVKEAV